MLNISIKKEILLIPSLEKKIKAVIRGLTETEVLAYLISSLNRKVPSSAGVILPHLLEASRASVQCILTADPGWPMQRFGERKPSRAR